MPSCAECGENFPSHRIIALHLIHYHRTESWITSCARFRKEDGVGIPNELEAGPIQGGFATTAKGGSTVSTPEPKPGPSNACSNLSQLPAPTDSLVNPRRPGFLYSREQTGINTNVSNTLHVRSIDSIGRTANGELKCLVQQEQVMVTVDDINGCHEALADLTGTYSRGDVYLWISQDGTVMFSPLHAGIRGQTQAPPPTPQGKFSGCFACLFCLTKYVGRKELKRHARTYHRENQLSNVFSCDKCQSNFTTRDDAEAHIVGCNFRAPGKKAKAKQIKISYAAQQTVLLQHMHKIGNTFFRQRSENPEMDEADLIQNVFKELLLLSKKQKCEMKKTTRTQKSASIKPLKSKNKIKKEQVPKKRASRPNSTPARRNPRRAVRSVTKSTTRSTRLPETFWQNLNAPTTSKRRTKAPTQTASKASTNVPTSSTTPLANPVASTLAGSSTSRPITNSVALLSQATIPPGGVAPVGQGQPQPPNRGPTVRNYCYIG